MKTDKIFLYGRNAFKEALLSRPDLIRKIYLDTNVQDDKSLMNLLKKNNLNFSNLKENTQSLEKGSVHQGVIAEINIASLYQDLEVVLEKINNEKPTLVLLDELQDPHNVGAIIRSAVAFGADAILMPEHNQSPITGAVIKTSVGMVFKIPIVKIGNVNQTIRLLKNKGYWIYGLAMEGSIKLTETLFDEPTVLVVGNEGDGIRQKTLELCDIKLSIPIEPDCESLNASIATSVVLYECYKQKKD